MSKGDRIGVATRGIVDSVTTIAEQAGRTVDFTFEKDGLINWLVVRETTRGGTVLRENRFPASEVLWMAVAKKEI